MDIACAFQILVEASKQDLAVLQTFQSLGAGILSRPVALSEMHARHVHVCYTCLSSLTGHQSPELKTTRGLDRAGKFSASDYLSVGKTPSFVRDLQDFVNLGLEDELAETARHDSEISESLDQRDDSSSQASFADVSSVGSGVDRERPPRVRQAAKTHRRGKNDVTDLRESSSGSEDESAKPIRQAKHRSLIKKQATPSAQPSHVGSGVRFDVDRTRGTTTTGTKAKDEVQPGLGRIERTLTKESMYSFGTPGSSVSIPILGGQSG